MSDTTIIEAPNGQLYEIPNNRLAEFEVPGERVAALRRQMAERQVAAAEANPGNEAVPPGHSAMPPGHSAMPPGHSAMPPGHSAMPTTSMTLNPGGGVVLNFFFHAPPPPPGASHGPTDSTSGDVMGYHMSFDEMGIPTNHTDMLWGDYVDKQGNPAVGWHNHDPVTGNAQ